MKVSAPMDRIHAYIAEGLIRYLVAQGIDRERAGKATVTIHLDGKGGGEFIFELPDCDGGKDGKAG